MSTNTETKPEVTTETWYEIEMLYPGRGWLRFDRGPFQEGFAIGMVAKYQRTSPEDKLRAVRVTVTREVLP